jgi:sugar phosphate isomerase/epimerase
MINRREFVVGAAGIPIAAQFGFGGAAADNLHSESLKLGVATYSLRKIPRTQAIEMIKKMGVTNVNVKENHLPYKDSPEQLRAGCKEFADAGLKIVAGGTISLAKDDDADMKKYFDYARTCGMPVIICAPTKETLPRLERFVKEYDIRAAIHNHGPEDKHFPSPYDVLNAVKNLDSRVGLCIDVGHTMRTGADVVKSIADAGSRLYNMHIKDLADPKGKGSQVEVGKGAMPIVAIFRQLKKMKYAGDIDLEYEIHENNPFEGMLESFAYMRGVLDALG